MGAAQPAVGCICPTCKRPMEAALAPLESLGDAPLGPRERRIVELLIGAYPRFITAKTLADHVYSADANGGPENATQVIRVIVHGLRRSLRRYGWTIPKAGDGPGTAGYRLEPVARSAV